MRLFFYSVAAIAGLSTLSAADILVSREVKSDGFQGMGASTKVTQTWISGNKHREQDLTDKKETSFLARMAADEKAKVTRLDKKVVWIIDEKKKRYQEISLKQPVPEGKDQESGGAESSGEAGPEEKPTTRISKAEFKVIPGGQAKTIAGYPCKDFTISALLETEDLESHEKTQMKMVTKLWTTAETGAVAKLQQEEAAYAKAWLSVTGASEFDMKTLGTAMMAGLMGSGEKELTKALAGMPAEMKKVKGYPLVTRVEWYGQDVATPLVGMTTEIKSISAEAIPASTFEVPAGYKKLS